VREGGLGTRGLHRDRRSEEPQRDQREARHWRSELSGGVDLRRDEAAQRVAALGGGLELRHEAAQQRQVAEGVGRLTHGGGQLDRASRIQARPVEHADAPARGHLAEALHRRAEVRVGEGASRREGTRERRRLEGFAQCRVEARGAARDVAGADLGEGFAGLRDRFGAAVGGHHVDVVGPEVAQLVARLAAPELVAAALRHADARREGRAHQQILAELERLEVADQGAAQAAEGPLEAFSLRGLGKDHAEAALHLLNLDRERLLGEEGEGGAPREIGM
jgi:hypothetical protein